MYLKVSRELNQLINMYFSIEVEESMEVQIAGSEEERNNLMPLLYVDSHREKAALEGEIRTVLKEYHNGQNQSQWMDPNNRMKPLDVTKVLMGINSARDNVKRFQNDNRVWARRQEYCYEDISKMASTTCSSYYLELLTGASVPKKKKLEANEEDNNNEQKLI